MHSWDISNLHRIKSNGGEVTLALDGLYRPARKHWSISQKHMQRLVDLGKVVVEEVGYVTIAKLVRKDNT